MGHPVHHLHNHEQFHIQIRTKMASWTAPLNIDRGWYSRCLIVIEWAAKTSLSWPWHHPDIQHIGCSALTPSITRLVLQAYDRHIALWWWKETTYFPGNFGIVGIWYTTLVRDWKFSLSCEHLVCEIWQFSRHIASRLDRRERKRVCGRAVLGAICFLQLVIKQGVKG